MRNNASKEYKIATLRDYVKLHEGEVITLQDFIVGTAITNIQDYLKKLIKDGRIVRTKSPGMGHRYMYTWVEPDEGKKKELLQNGEVVSHTPDLPNLPIDPKAVGDLLQLFADWVDTLDVEDDKFADHVKGASLFRCFVRDQLASVQNARKRLHAEFLAQAHSSVGS